MFTSHYFGDQLTTPWLFGEMALAGLVVIIGAVLLTKLADRFADEWGLGKAFVGMLLLATVTSLPEVVAGGTAGFIGAPDMAYGAVYGSCSFNIIIIVVMNFALAGGGTVLGQARPAQFLSSSFGMILLAISLMGIGAVQKYDGRPMAQQIAEIFTAILIVGVYIYAMSLTQRFERREEARIGFEPQPQRSVGLVVQLMLVALLVIAASWWLTQTGDVLSEHRIEALGRPLGKTVVGLFFLAAATSLPEVATSLTAVRMNNLDMALGNVFGSNMFNILVLPVVKIAAWASGDPLVTSGPNFHVAANVQAGILPILLTAIAVASIAYRTKKRLWHLGFDSVILLAAYVLGLLVILGQ